MAYHVGIDIVFTNSMYVYYNIIIIILFTTRIANYIPTEAMAPWNTVGVPAAKDECKACLVNKKIM